MSKRVLYISLGVIALILMLGLAAAAGGAVTYFVLRARPARAALSSREFIPNFGAANLNGALIRQVTPDSPAAKAGLQAGEIIVSIDGQGLGSQTDLAEVIRSHKPGDSISLSVKRATDGQTREVQVTLGENPDQAGQAYLGVRYVSLPAMRTPGDEANPFRFFPRPGTGGNNGQTPTPQPPSGGLPFAPNLPELPDGVDQGLIITQVQPDSPADRAGLQSQDLITEIDGKSTGAPQAFAETIQNHKPGDQVTLTVYRKGESNPLSIQVRLEENPAVSGQTYLGVTVGVFIRENQNLGPQSQRNFGPLPGEPSPHQGSGT